MKTTRELVGQRVSELRKRAGWTQAELAEKTAERLGKDMSTLTVTRIESGSRPTSVDELVALAEVFSVPAQDLLPLGSADAALRTVVEEIRINSQRVAEARLALEAGESRKIVLDELGQSLLTLNKYLRGDDLRGVADALKGFVEASYSRHIADLRIETMDIVLEFVSLLPKNVADGLPAPAGGDFDEFLDALGKALEDHGSSS